MSKKPALSNLDIEITDNINIDDSKILASAKAVKTVMDYIVANGLGSSVRLNNADFNQLTNSGFYYVYGLESINYPPGAPSGTGYLLVVNHGLIARDYVMQMFWYYKSDIVYIRKKSENGWGDWRELRHTVFDRGTNVPSGADLNDYNVPGIYCIISGEVLSTLNNRPPMATNGNHIMHVMENASSNYVMQILYQLPTANNNSEHQFLYRNSFNGEWGEWHVKYTSKNMRVSTTPPSSALKEHEIVMVY